MSLGRILRHLPEGFEIVLADVGSSGGIKDRWAPARRVVSALLFEPRDGGERRQQGQDTLYPVGLGRERGRALLNITALANMSSTLSPNRVLLETFLQRPRQVLSKAQLEERLYSFGEEVESNTIEVHVSRLRKKLGHAIIETVRGLGYRLGSPP